MAGKTRIHSTTGTFGHERMIIRECMDVTAMHRFLNTGGNSLEWSEYNGPLPRGTYAFVGGVWHNVKTLDRSLLALI